MKFRWGHNRLPETPKLVWIVSLFIQSLYNRDIYIYMYIYIYIHIYIHTHTHIYIYHLVVSKAKNGVICLTSQVNQGYLHVPNARKTLGDFIRVTLRVSRKVPLHLVSTLVHKCPAISLVVPHTLILLPSFLYLFYPVPSIIQHSPTPSHWENLFPLLQGILPLPWSPRALFISLPLGVLRLQCNYP